MWDQPYCTKCCTNVAPILNQNNVKYEHPWDSMEELEIGLQIPKNPVNTSEYGVLNWWAQRDLNPRPNDYESCGIFKNTQCFRGCREFCTNFAPVFEGRDFFHPRSVQPPIAPIPAACKLVDGGIPQEQSVLASCANRRPPIVTVTINHQAN